MATYDGSIDEAGNFIRKREKYIDAFLNITG